MLFHAKLFYMSIKFQHKTLNKIPPPFYLLVSKLSVIFLAIFYWLCTLYMFVMHRFMMSWWHIAQWRAELHSGPGRPCKAARLPVTQAEMLEVNVFSFMIVRGDGLRTSSHVASGGVSVNTQHHFSVHRQMAIFCWLLSWFIFVSRHVNVIWDKRSSGPWNKDL